MARLEITGGTPRDTVIRLDGQDLSGAVQGLRLVLDARSLPMLELEIPVVEVTSLDVEVTQAHIPGSTRELLVRLGWTPPEDSGRERAKVVEMIRGYFAASDDPLYEDVRILCGRIERGEHMPTKVKPEQES